MEKKREKVVETKPVEEKPVAEDFPMLPMIEAKSVEVKTEALKKELSSIVKVKVLIGTLQFEQGTFSKGDTFTVSRERMKQFDQRDIQILEA